MKPIYAMLLGAGLKGTVVGVIRQALGGLGGVGGNGLVGISDDMLAIGLGYLIMQKTKGNTSDIGAGIFIAGGAGFVEGLVGGMPIFGGTTATAKRTTATTVRQAPQVAGSLEQAAAAL